MEHQEEIFELEETELIEPDFSEEINKRKAQITKRTNIIFIAVIVILLTRIFDRYTPFNVVLNSVLLLVVFTFTTFFAVAARLFVSSVKVYAKDAMTNNVLKKFNDFLDLIIVVPVFMAVVTLINISLLSLSNVEGSSMEPNYYDQEDIIIYHPPGLEYERFDVVILQVDNGDFYIKRIIGMPGETVQIDNDTVLINGKELDQSSIGLTEETFCNPSYGDNCEFEVPEGMYFVLGDNRTSSNDSRSTSVGFIREEEFFGKVVYKYKNMLRTQEK